MTAIYQKTLTNTQKEMISIIRYLYRKNVPLNISAIRESHPDLLLAVYRIKPFWGWRNALETAGLDYSKINFYLPEFIICHVCGKPFKALTKHIREIHKMQPVDYKALYHVSVMTSPLSFTIRSYCQIMPHWEKNWTPEYILDRIYELSIRGVPLNVNHITKVEGSTYYWAIKFFKTWDVVLRAVGLNPMDIRKSMPAGKWTKGSVKRVIVQQYMLGRDVNWTAMSKYNKSLPVAARRLFKGYDNALKASGINPDTARKTPKASGMYKTKEAVEAAIFRKKLCDEPLHDYAVTHGEHKNLALWNKARRIFGSWRLAVEAAGYDYNKLTPERTKYKEPADVINGIKCRHEKGLLLTTKGVRKGKDRDSNLYARAHRFYNDWASALKAAGIDPAAVKPSLARYSTKEAVISAVKKRYCEKKPLDYKSIRRGEDKDQALYTTGLRLFGTWIKVIKQAGIHVDGLKHPKGRYPAKKDVARELKRRFKKNLPLFSSYILKGPEADKALYNKALKFYGGWRNAIISVGIDYDKIMKQRKKKLIVN